MKRTTIVAVAFGMAILSSAAGCSQSETAPKTANVTPADADYPIANTHPRHIIQVELLAPTSFNLQLSAIYSATSGRDSQSISAMCHFVAEAKSSVGALGTLTPYSVEIPIPIVPLSMVEKPRSVAEKRYQAKILVDNFARGRCDWTLDRVIYRVKDAENGSRLFDFDGGRSSFAMAGSDRLLTFWCKSTAETDAGENSEVCIGHKADSPNDARFDARVFPIHLGFDDTYALIEFRDEDHPVESEPVIP